MMDNPLAGSSGLSITGVSRDSIRPIDHQREPPLPSRLRILNRGRNPSLGSTGRPCARPVSAAV